MPRPGLDQEKRLEKEEKIRQQIAFASGLFQGDVTVRTLLDSLAEGCVIIDNTGTILLVNHRTELMFGYLKKDLIGKPHAVLIPERFRKTHEEHEESFFAEPRIRPMGQFLELIGRRQDESEFPLEISLSFIETIVGVLVLAFISDVTLRKQFETRLRESEELFHIQVERVKDYAVFTLDSQGLVLNWNAGAEGLKGYRAEEIVGKHFACFYSEEDRTSGKPEVELKKAAAEGQSEEEGWRIRKDGTGFWADVVITALHDESGNLWGFSTVTHDISERKKAQEALRFSEARYRALFSDNPTMIFTLDAEWAILSANPFAASQLGYTIDELEGQSVLNLFHEDDRAAVAEQLLGCLKNSGQVHRWQFRKIRKDGELLWVEEIAQAVHDLNGVINVLVVCQDITDRRRAEQALQKSEIRFRRLFEAAKDGIIIINAETEQIVDINPFLVEMLGYSREEVIGNKLWDIGALADVAENRACFAELQQEEYIRYEDLPLVTKDGRQINLEFVSNSYTVDGTKMIQCNIRDISDRKRAEQEIQRLNADLVARAAELEAANSELEAFNYTVAHDLRQPLSMVNGYCQAIDKLCGEQLQEDCKDYVREAYNSTLRMNQLIDSLLNFSRLGHVEPHREMTNLSELAHEVIKALKLTESKRLVDFRIADGILANGEASLLRVVLDNLLGNALKYTGMCERAVIEFGVRDIDGVPTYFVRDNGAGFDMADADKLFTPFQRISSAEKYRGFGIGLATVQRIIRRHGGKVWAEGEPGKGACIFFTLSTD